MSGADSSVLSGVINFRMLFFVLALALLVLLAGYITARNKRTRKSKPGQYLRYESQKWTAAQCLDLLEHENIHDIFSYTMETAAKGGWYLTLTLHNPTNQMLATVFQLQFETETPARFSLTFVREAFGAKEPVMPEAMLDEFFLQKLDATRLDRRNKSDDCPQKGKKNR